MANGVRHRLLLLRRGGEWWCLGSSQVSVRVRVCMGSSVFGMAKYIITKVRVGVKVRARVRVSVRVRGRVSGSGRGRVRGRVSVRGMLCMGSSCPMCLKYIITKVRVK